jgi:hypothetical protein
MQTIMRAFGRAFLVAQRHGAFAQPALIAAGVPYPS